MFAGGGEFALADGPTVTWTGTGPDTRAVFAAEPATNAWRALVAGAELRPSGGAGLPATGWVA